MSDLSPEKQFDNALLAHVNCPDPAMFIRRRDKRLVSNESFNREFAGLFNQVAKKLQRLTGYRDNPAKYASGQNKLCRVVKGTCYEPGAPEINGRGEYNMFVDPGIKPLDASPEIFLEHINYLIPDDTERKLVLDFMAWAVQHPERKITFALLIVGRGGTGKSWLLSLMQRLFGESNVVIFDKDNVAANRFNAELQFRRLICYDEIKSLKVDLAEEIAGLITSREIRIERKGIDAFHVKNTANIMAVSNYVRGINIRGEHTRRRWAVAYAEVDKPSADNNGRETDATVEYFKRLWAVLPDDGRVSDEVRRVLWYLSQRDVVDFNPNNPPRTEAQAEIAEATSTARADSLAAMWKTRTGPFRFDLFTIAEVMRDGVTVDKNKFEDPKVVEAEVSAILVELGGRKVSKRRRYYRGKETRLWTRKRDLEKFQAMSPDELRAHYDAERSDPLFDDAAMFDQSDVVEEFAED